MSATRVLPPGLEQWSAALSALHPSVVQGLGPMLHALERLVHRTDLTTGASGELDGYDGLTTSGSIDRLAMSEWALAQEHPMEFLRRSAERELLSLAPAYRSPTPRGDVVLLLDSGPDHWGAPRLAQLAVLIVLHRRASDHGAGFRVGVMGDGAGDWLDGELSTILPRWLARRAARTVTSEIVSEHLSRTSVGTAENEVWVVTSPATGRRMPRADRVLEVSESQWGPEGVTGLLVRLGNDETLLPMPPGDVGVRALRSAGTRGPDEVGRPGPITGIHQPTFTSTSAHIEFRGAASTLLTCAISQPGSRGTSPRLREHRFPGTVLAAAWYQRRLLAVVLEGEVVKVKVVGKPLSRLADVALSLEDLGETTGSLQRSCADRLPTAAFDRGALLTPLAGRWWRLDATATEEHDVVAIGVGITPDQPRIVRDRGDGRFLPGSRETAGAARHLVPGPDGWVARSDDGVSWQMHQWSSPGPMIEVPDGQRPIALVTDEGRPALVTTSTAGLILRLVRPEGQVVTLTSRSGGLGRPAVHPTRPWIATQPADDLVRISDLFTDETVFVIRGKP